jgi:LuxR family transcriptional regulator, maltose regulon positive regulatory protein
MDRYIRQPPHPAQQNLLITKFNAPVYPRKSVQRARLTSLLNQGRECRLAIVVAPAGYGKTILLREWTGLAENLDWSVAWLSLDEQDNGIQFWSYFIGALQTLDSTLRFDWHLEDSTTPNSIDFHQIKILLNQIAQIPFSFSLILDDYQEIQAEDIHRGLAYVIDYMPKNMHLVIVSRTLPPIQLARLRAQSELIEILAADLAFTPYETGIFLNQVMEIQADEEDISALIEATEGWIAGLQMAVLSLKNGREIKNIIADFTGNYRHIMDYLTEEVVSQQSEEIRSFMIKSSLLSRMTASVCDEVLGIRDSYEKLLLLEQNNLFIIPLDEERLWYRYHPLMVDYLKSAIERSDPDEISQMHRRACIWWKKNGYPEQAIPHAMANQDYETVADIAEEYLSRTLLRPVLILIIHSVDHLPAEIYQKRPRLAMLILLAHVALGQKKELERSLKEFEGIVNQAANNENHEQGVMSNQGLVLCMRAVTTCILGDYEQGIDIARQAQLALKPEEFFVAGMLAHFVSYAYFAYGRLDEAAAMLNQGIKISLAYEMDPENLSSMAALARVYRSRGWLHEAEKVYLEALRYANRKAVGIKAISFIQAGLSDVYWEWNQLDQADLLIHSAQVYHSRSEAGFLEWNYCPDYSLIFARNYLAHGNCEMSIKYVEAANSLISRYYKIPYLAAQIKDIEVRTWIHCGNLSRLASWIVEMNARRLIVGEHLSLIEKIALARANLALGRSRDSLEILQLMNQREQSIPLLEYQIDLYLIKALAMSQLSETAGAREAVLHALKLAEPGGYVMVFIGYGLPMKLLLEEVLENLQKRASDSKSGVSITRYIKMLLLQFGMFREGKTIRPETVVPPLPVESLSNREQEVLKFIVYGLSPKEISERLVISVHTTRTHIKKIYQKLDVHNREEVTEKAILLGLLE